MNDTTLQHLHLPLRDPQAATGQYRIGMPQLGLNGLSESWLLAECGDRHWQLLAAANGRPVAKLQDSRLRRVYPAFRAVRLRNAALDAVVENEVLQIASLLGRVSRTQFYSKHLVSSPQGIHAVVEMQSVFLTRETAGDNTSSVRSAVPGFDSVPALDEGLRFAACNRSRLRDHPEQDANLHRLSGEGFAPQQMSPCPSIHFNGAGFLYFARFHEFADIAEASWLGRMAYRLVTSERHIVFHGNADPGVPLIVQPKQLAQQDGALDHHLQILRGSDAQVIADVFSQRRGAREGGMSFERTVALKTQTVPA